MENNTSSRSVGYNGEDIAVKFLIENGFNIIKRNFRYKHYEIDLIASKSDCLHFIEVKFRKNNNFGYPESFVSDSQKCRIKLAAEKYIYDISWSDRIMFDIVSM